MKKISDISVRQSMVPRSPDSYKGDYGHVLIIGGNVNMGGAIILSASAAVHSGAGTVTTATDSSNKTALLSRLPESMVVSWDDTQALREQIKQADVVLIGPGMGTDAFAKQLFQSCLEQLTKEQILILDGDALTLLSDSIDWIKNLHPILTPHLGEWKQLSGLSPDQENVEENKKKVKELQADVVLKKHRTEIYLKEDVFENPLGNPGMATGGMGDTLAGMIAGFTAQYEDKDRAIIAAVYLHSRIGEGLFKNQHVTLPTHIIEEIPFIMKKYQFQRLPTV